MKQLIELNPDELAEMAPVRQQMDLLATRHSQIVRLAQRRAGIDPDTVKGIAPRTASPTGQDWSGVWVELPDQAEVPGSPAPTIEVPKGLSAESPEV